MSGLSLSATLRFSKEQRLDALIELGVRALEALQLKYTVNKDRPYFRLSSAVVTLYYLDVSKKDQFSKNRKNVKEVLITAEGQAAAKAAIKVQFESFVQILDALVKAYNS